MNKLSFAVENITPLSEGIDTSQFSLLQVDAFATGRSLHDTFVTEETLRRTAETILLKPFVFAIDERFSDLSTHVEHELPGGFVPHNSPITFKRMEDGRTMMSVNVLIWKRYSGKLLEYFERDGKRKGVSVEIEVRESREDEKSGLMEIVDFVYTCITGLGDLISPAIPDAQAVLAFAEEYKKDVIEFSKYESIDFTIPKAVKTTAKKALESNKGSAVAMAMARFLVKNEKATPDRIRQMKKFFGKKNLSKDDISFNLYGGAVALKWCREMSALLDEADEKQMSYFSEKQSGKSDTRDSGDLKKEEDKQNMTNTNNMAADPQEEEQVQKEEMAEPVKEEVKEEMAEPTEEQKQKDEDVRMAEPVAEKKEEEVEEKEEEKEEEEYSLYGAIFADEKLMSLFSDEDKAKFADGKKKEMFEAMKEFMCRMASENEELKKFKHAVDEKQKEFAVATTLKNLTAKFSIPEDEVEKMKLSAQEFSFDRIETWQNVVKAKAVDFAIKTDTKEDAEFMIYALPFNSSEKAPSRDDVWAQ